MTLAPFCARCDEGGTAAQRSSQSSMPNSAPFTANVRSVPKSVSCPATAICSPEIPAPDANQRGS